MKKKEASSLLKPRFSSLLFLSFFLFLSSLPYVSPFHVSWHEKMRVIEKKTQFCWVVGDTNLTAKYILATNQKDEGRLAEWIGHHLLLGFDGVLVFDDFSENPVEFLNYLPEEARKKVVVFLRCPRSPFITKMIIQQNIANAARHIPGGKWFMHLDADEFLTLNPLHFSNLSSWLDSFSPNAVEINCNWVMYGTSYLQHSPEDLLFRSFPYRDKEPFHLIKCLQRLTIPKQFWWQATYPHYMTLESREKNATYDRYYAHGDGRPWTNPTYNVENHDMNSTCLIAHYTLQSIDDCMKRKVLRPRDDVQKFRDKKYCSHEKFNEVYDPERMETYADLLENYLIDPEDSSLLLNVEDFIPHFDHSQYQGPETHYTTPKKHIPHSYPTKRHMINTPQHHRKVRVVRKTKKEIPLGYHSSVLGGINQVGRKMEMHKK